MRSLLRKGHSVPAVADQMGRTYRSVESRMRRLRDIGEMDPLSQAKKPEVRKAERQIIQPVTHIEATSTAQRSPTAHGLGTNGARIETAAASTDHSQFTELVALAKKHGKNGGLDLEAVCDSFGLTPSEGRALVQKAIDAGYAVDIAHGKLDFRPAHTLPPQEVVADVKHLEMGEEIVVGVVSDPHFASKHHENDALKRHIEWLHGEGVRHIFGPGDWVAGDYRFLKYEITHTGIEDQSEQVANFIREYGTDFNWWAIAGNHDESFNVGINAAKMIEQQLLASGHKNFKYLGARAGLLRLHNTRFGMHHPGGGLSYAISYKIQKYVDEQPPHRRAQFLFTGHTHQQLYIRRGGCHSFLCGTFENGDSSFGRMLGGDISVGSWLVRYRLDNKGNVAHVSPEFRSQPSKGMNFIQVPGQLDASAPEEPVGGEYPKQKIQI